MDHFVNAPELLLHMAQEHATKLMIDAPSPPVFFHGDRVMTAKDYADSLSPEECKLLVQSLLSDEQMRRLKQEHSIMVAFDVSGVSRFKMLATEDSGIYSALITAS